MGLVWEEERPGAPGGPALAQRLFPCPIPRTRSLSGVIRVQGLLAATGRDDNALASLSAAGAMVVVSSAAAAGALTVTTSLGRLPGVHRRLLCASVSPWTGGAKSSLILHISTELAMHRTSNEGLKGSNEGFSNEGSN